MESIFPFWLVNKECNVIVYGAGNVGKDYYLTHEVFEFELFDFYSETHQKREHAHILAWVDNNVDTLFGNSVEKPSVEIFDNDCKVLIATKNRETYEDIICELVDLYSVSEERIIWHDPAIESDLVAFVNWFYEYRTTYISGRVLVRLHAVSFRMLAGIMKTLLEYRIELVNEGFNPENISTGIIDIYGHKCATTGEYLATTAPNSIKVAFFAGESYLPDYTVFNYGISNRKYDFPRHLYSRFYFPDNELVQNRERFMDENLNYRRFCNFVYSNQLIGDGAIFRKIFCQKLSDYKRVDAAGKVLNNIQGVITPRNGNWFSGKLSFLRNYKFTIAFENQQISGYTTEKLFQAFYTGSIPIYWGNPDITEYIEPNSFINCNDYCNDFDRIIKKVIEIDNDPAQYRHMLSISPMRQTYKYDWREKMHDFFKMIIEENGLLAR